MIETNDFFREVAFFFEPLAVAVGGTEPLLSFFRDFGYDLRTRGSDLLDAVGAIRPPIGDTFAALLGAATNGGSGLEVARDVFRALSTLATSNAVQSHLRGADTFPEEVFDHLARRYLGFRLPIVVGVLGGLGVLVEVDVAPTDAGGRDLAYRSIRLQWSRLGDFVRDNERWAYDVYRWGGAPQIGDGRTFDYELAISRLMKLIETTQLATTRRERLSDQERGAFLKGATNGVRAGALPILQDTFADVVDGAPVFTNEAGLKVMPFGDVNRPEKLGLALAPYAKGAATGTQPITDRLALTVAVDGQATGGAAIALTPDGIEVVNRGQAQGSFEFRLRYQRPDGSPVILAGKSDGTRIETKAIVGSVGGSFAGDFQVGGGFLGLGAVIDVREDGFLGALIPEPIEIEAGDVLMGWRNGRGVYFEGGSNVAVTVPLELQLGPITLHELVLALDWADDLTASIAVSGEARLGPLFAAVEGAGIDVTVEPAPAGDGLLGRYDLGFGFRAPTGYAIALDAAPIEGGGYLSVGEDEYRGALALKFESIGFSAFAILNTRLPGGKQGFSLAASIFGEFNLPLGYGFFLTGLGGIIGINRTCDTGALRDVLFAGRMDNLLFPADPIGNASTILDDMAAILPPRDGQYLFGPVARIGWGVPTLVEVKLGVVLELGAEVRLLVLGGLSCNLPTRETALVALNMSFFGEIDFAAGTVSFDASLQGSRILTFPIAGDAAIRTGWGPKIEHIASFGGLHPRYPRPAGLPDLRRLSINFGTNNPKVTLSAYQAASLSALMFGARAELYAKGPKLFLVGQVAAEGQVAFDTLIHFNPFSFDVTLGGGLSLLVDGDVVGGLGFDLRLTGPNGFQLTGKAWVTMFGMDIEFPINHSWGKTQKLPKATVDAVATLRAALQQSKGFEPVAPRGRSSGVSFRDADDVATAIDPIGGLRLVQRAVPLGVAIEKIGEAQIVGPKRLALKVFDAGVEIAPEAAELDFVRGHFFPLTDAQRLRATAFESHTAGFEIAADALVLGGGPATEAEHGYEVIAIGADDRAAAPILVHAPLRADFATRFFGATHEEMRPTASLRDRLRPARPITVVEQRFIGAGLSDLAQSSRSIDRARAATDRRPANRAVSTYIAAAQMQAQAKAGARR
jgi:uncharacterized protein DUF6603